VWDIFQQQDVPALTEYLMKHCGEFSHAGKPIKREAIAHAIHSQVSLLPAQCLSQHVGSPFSCACWRSHFLTYDSQLLSFVGPSCAHTFVRTTRAFAVVVCRMVGCRRLDTQWLYLLAP